MIAGEPTPAGNPGQAAFDDPSSGQDLKASTRGPSLFVTHHLAVLLFVLDRDQTSHHRDGPTQMLLNPFDERAAVMALTPQELEAAKALFDWLQQAFGSLQVRVIGSRHFDCQEMARLFDQHVSFASPDFFPHVNAFLRTANGTGFDRLTVDDSGAGLWISALPLPQLSTEALQDPIPDPFVAPGAEVPVDAAPGRQIVGQEPERPAAAQDVQDGIHDFAPLIPEVGSRFSACRHQGFQDLRLRVAQIGWVGFPAW